MICSFFARDKNTGDTMLRDIAEIVVLTAFITALLIWAPVIAGV